MEHETQDKIFLLEVVEENEKMKLLQCYVEYQDATTEIGST